MNGEEQKDIGLWNPHYIPVQNMTICSMTDGELSDLAIMVAKVQALALGFSTICKTSFLHKAKEQHGQGRPHFWY